MNQIITMPRPASRYAVVFMLVTLIINGGSPARGQLDAGEPADITEPPKESNPARFRVVVENDLTYRDVPPENRAACGRCSVYLPKFPQQDPANKNHRHPVILAVHGGGWAAGNKWTMDRHCRELASNGFAAVAINYRLAPTSKFPEQVDDLRLALVWINKHADKYAFDVNRVGLYGYSAGGHLVSLVATAADEPWETKRLTTHWSEQDAHWKQIPKIMAVCVGGTPTDFRQLPLDNTTMTFFLGGSRRERPQVYASASPVCFVSNTDPPFQIIHGEADGLVSISNSQRFHKALRDANVEASLLTIPGKGHLFAFISPQLSSTMLGFFQKRLAD